jgi:hypothetical protein
MRRYIMRQTLWLCLVSPALFASITSLMESGLSIGKFISNWPVGLWLSCVFAGLVLGPPLAWLCWANFEKEYHKYQTMNE